MLLGCRSLRAVAVMSWRLFVLATKRYGKWLWRTQFKPRIRKRYQTFHERNDVLHPLTSVDLKAERVRMLFHQMTLGDLIDVQACNEDTPDTLLFRIIDGSVVVRLQTYDPVSDQMYRRALVSL